MERKANIDALGATYLIGFSALLGLNQVVIKLTNVGLQPVFSAGLRSLGAMIVLYLWMKFRGQSIHFERKIAVFGLIAGVLFASEFILLFIAIDLTSVARTSIMFYSMPFWLAIMVHFTIPSERLTRRKVAGLILAFFGVILVLFSKNPSADGSIKGDLFALIGSMGWAGIALNARITPFQHVSPMMQNYWQVSVSSVLLLVAALFFGPLIREFTLFHAGTMAFQIVVVASAGFMFWFWLLKRYPAAGVASFGFLAPIFGVGFGWLILDEEVGPLLLLALVLVCAGLILINRPARQVPQKV